MQSQTTWSGKKFAPGKASGDHVSYEAHIPVLWEAGAHYIIGKWNRSKELATSSKELLTHEILDSL